MKMIPRFSQRNVVKLIVPSSYIPTKRTLLFLVVMVIGCAEDVTTHVAESMPMLDIAAMKKDDSTACAYWMCSKTKKLYMQKYVKNANGEYKAAGAYKLDEGVGAFPLEDLDKYGSDGETVSIDEGHDNCPYCGNTSLALCSRCGDKTYCESETATSGTCPRCGRSASYRSGTWGVGGGG